MDPGQAGAVEGDPLASSQRVWGTVWQVRYNPSLCSISCCNMRGCGWRRSRRQGCVLRWRSWAASLNHPYLDHPYLTLHIPATATWVIANWTEGLHLMWIVTERSSSFVLQTLKTCPTLRSESDTKRGDCMGARGLLVPLLGGCCCVSFPAFRAWGSRRLGVGCPRLHCVCLFHQLLFVSLGSDFCPSSTSWAAKHWVLPRFSAGTHVSWHLEFHSAAYG